MVIHKIVSLVTLFLLIEISSFSQKKSDDFEINIRDFTTTSSILGPKDIIRLTKDSVFIYLDKRLSGFGKEKSSTSNLADILVFSSAHSLDIFTCLNKIDSLKPIYSNHCLIGGMMFYFHATCNGKELSTWISNAYQKDIFLILDILNPIIPDQYRIRYDLLDIQRKIDECETLLTKESE